MVVGDNEYGGGPPESSGTDGYWHARLFAQADGVWTASTREMAVREWPRGIVSGPGRLASHPEAHVEVPPFETPSTAAQKAAFERFSDAVIDRLFALNAERAAAEEASAPASARPARTRRPPKKAAPPAKRSAGASTRPRTTRKKAS